MSYFFHDPDEWETYSTSTPCGSCLGDMTRCNGCCTGSAFVGMRRRAPEHVARIKADRLRAEEDEILRRADAIRAARVPTAVAA